MEFLKIVALAVVSAILYGLIHDQVTARVCVEYFTVFHVRILDTESPAALALAWGVIATWWVGFGLGVPVAMFARFGRRPKLAARDLVKPVIVLMLVTGVSSLIAGLCAFVLSQRGDIALWEPLASQVPVERHAAFLADLWAHRTAYGVGYFGSIFLWGWCVYRRNLIALANRRAAET